MADGAAVDTDVLLKSATYRSGAELVAILRSRGLPATLRLTHLIAPRQLARKRGVRHREEAQLELENLLVQFGRLEPDDDEIALAAELAASAQQQGLPLDAGEAQLAAITMLRGLPLLVTGDKRAVGALATLWALETDRTALAGRLACFEQIVASITALIGEHEMRLRVCVEPDVDGAMRLACSCDDDEWDPMQLHEACESFIRAVRSHAGDLLVPGSTLA
jgi:predicted nucleic acid-binding protein